jgi:hypothetical protein
MRIVGNLCCPWDMAFSPSIASHRSLTGKQKVESFGVVIWSWTLAKTASPWAGFWETIAVSYYH